MKIQLETEWLTIFESQLFNTTTTLFIGDDYLLLIDPNWLPSEIEFIHNYVDKIKSDKECFLAFTHSDYDHIIGYGKFLIFKSIATNNFVNNKNIASIINQIANFDDQYYILRDYPIEYPKIDIEISKLDENIILGEEKYRFYQAPGHNADGMIIHNIGQGILIVGDYLSNVEFPYIYHSVKLYKECLDRVERIINDFDINVLISGHGDYTDNKEEMMTRISDSRNYLMELEKHVLEGTPFDLERLFEKYRFPKIMLEFHTNNIALLKKELK